jgi:NAD(P)-dependent dehydrogenase (short-subunit alcohol dehydrogenase family)
MRSIADPILIIGGTSGIGFAAAQLFVSSGSNVVIVGRNKAKLETALRAIGPSAQGEIADATDRPALNALFERHGTIGHLVLVAAGGGGAGLFPEIQCGVLRDGFDGKFWAQWNAAQSSLPFLAPAGSITFITAAASRHASPGTSGLAAINGALDRMVPALARELAPIRVNAISPGIISTAWWLDRPPELFKSLSGQAPLGRAGKPEEVADAVVFLVRNAFITGVVLDVDGGLHLT